MAKVKLPLSERIAKVTEKWFLSDSLMFAAFCTHKLIENRDMKAALRSGKRLIEYNPDEIEDKLDFILASMFKAEMVRILLKHPYQRKPFGAKNWRLSLASNLTIALNSSKEDFCHDLVDKGILAAFPPGRSFEEYYALIETLLNNETLSEEEDDSDDDSDDSGDNGQSDTSDDNEDGQSDTSDDSGDDKPESSGDSGNKRSESSGDGGEKQSESSGDGGNEQSSKPSMSRETREQLESLAENWQEDSMTSETLNEIIEREASRSYSLCGSWQLSNLIKASLVPPINISAVLRRFKTSILSQRRKLTRMYPSRRYGFEQMGSRFAYTTRLLVAVDLSGSVSLHQINRMLGTINRLFKQGIEQVEVLTFDTQIHLPTILMRKARKRIQLVGRGGTNFQPVADYYAENRYDGLIYITDGHAPNPVPANPLLPVAWIIIKPESPLPTIEMGWDRRPIKNN